MNKPKININTQKAETGSAHGSGTMGYRMIAYFTSLQPDWAMCLDNYSLMVWTHYCVFYFFRGMVGVVPSTRFGEVGKYNIFTFFPARNCSRG
jgi:hypothetical protein